MADDDKIRNFLSEIRDVKKEYSKDSFEYSIPNELIATIAAVETGNLEFKGAPTAKKANNFFGIHPYGDQKFLPTQGGSKLTQYDTPKDSIRAFIKLLSTQDEYEDVRKSIEQGKDIENHFKGLSKYAEREDYTDFVTQVYRTRIYPITNPILPKRKPLDLQMDGLK